MGGSVRLRRRPRLRRRDVHMMLWQEKAGARYYVLSLVLLLEPTPPPPGLGLGSKGMGKIRASLCCSRVPLLEIQ